MGTVGFLIIFRSEFCDFGRIGYILVARGCFPTYIYTFYTCRSVGIAERCMVRIQAGVIQPYGNTFASIGMTGKSVAGAIIYHIHITNYPCLIKIGPAFISKADRLYLGQRSQLFHSVDSHIHHGHILYYR